jgi:CAAX protease family protein
MMDTRLNTKRILIFLAFAIGIPWATTLATVIKPELEIVLNWTFITAPALANIATRLITREGWGRLWRPNFRRGWRFYLVAWLLPLLTVIPGSLIYYLLFPQSFDPNFTAARDQIVIFRSAAAAGPWTAMLALIVEQMIVQGLVIGVLAIGEEFGWRAYLLQKLMDRFGSARKAALLVGVIWGVWHWPGMFMGLGIDNNYPGAPFLFPLVYLLSTSSLSILLSWVTLRSGSVWPAAIGHTTDLATGGLAMGMMKGPVNALVSPNPQSLIGDLGSLVLALVLYFNRKAFAVEQETRSARVPAVAVTNPG